MWLIAIIIMSVSPEKGRKMVKPSVVLMACAEWTITLSAFSWFEDNWSSCYLWCIHSHTTVFFRKTNDGCLQMTSALSGELDIVSQSRSTSLFLFSPFCRKAWKSFGALDLVDLISSALHPQLFLSPACKCYLQYPLFAPLILTQPPNQRCR